MSYSHIRERIESISVEHGQCDAIIHGDVSLKYDDLISRAKYLALGIVQQCDSNVIAIDATRSIEMVINVLACLFANKAYVPIDLRLPNDRLVSIKQEAGLEFVLLSDIKNEEDFCRLGFSILKEPSDNSLLPVLPDIFSESLLYILFTSGSTGIPKGVEMSEAALRNLLIWQEKNSLASVGDRTLQFAPLTFDVSFQEIYSTLTTGGTIVLIDDADVIDPERLLNIIVNKSVNRLFLPFVALQILVDEAVSSSNFPASLKEVVTAGEQLKITPQLRTFFSNTNSKLYNQYGPTECHVVTCLLLQNSPNSWPELPSIGKPIDNVEILILDDSRNILDVNQSGEIAILGEALADGYTNPELTKEKFVYLNYRGKSTRAYLSGDIGYVDGEGYIYCLGRKDEQIKISGYRVELGEIEVSISRVAGIKNAVVKSFDINDAKILIAYYISNDTNLDDKTIKTVLSKTLPPYMIPSRFIRLDEFPYTSSGKVDKKNLPNPIAHNSKIEMQEIDIKSMIANTIKSILNVSVLSDDDNFFDLGMSSLLAIKTASILKNEYKIKVPVSHIFSYPSLRQLYSAYNGVNESQKLLKLNKVNEDIAIIAMTGRFPGADSLDDFWEIIKSGRSTITSFTKEELDPYLPKDLINDPLYVKARGILKDADCFDANFFGISPKEAELMDPQQRLFLELSYEVLQKANINLEHTQVKIGVFAGTANNTYYTHNVLSNQSLVNKIGAFKVMTLNEKDYIASRVAYLLNLKGPAVSVYSGCSTSALAITQAVNALRSGQCNMAIAGGVSITSPINSGHLYEEGAMLSKDGSCKPFDVDANGTVFSDGAGVLLLKPLSNAIEDGDVVLSVIKGIGVNNDGANKAAFTAPSALGQADAIKSAILDAGIESKDITYIEAHGTATPIGDPIEIEGLKLAFYNSSSRSNCAIGSVKSNIGHLTAAAGVAGVIKTILQFQNGAIAPIAHFSTLNANIDIADTPFYFSKSYKEQDSNNIKYAGVSSFGVGGTNVHIILENKQIHPVTIESDTPLSNIMIWSAKSERSVSLYKDQLGKFLLNTSSQDFFNIAATLADAKQDYNYRAFAIGNASSIIKKIESAKPKKSYNNKIAFTFPGQGAQYINMGASLYLYYKEYKQAVDSCSAILLPIINADIRQIIFGTSADASVLLNNTKYTQPAIFVTSYALAIQLQAWGIHPDVFIGHSIGEFVAAHLAGILSLEDALTLVAKRGELIAKLPQGKMLVVKADYNTVKQYLSDSIQLAAINSSSLFVLSGTTSSIHSLSEELKSKHIIAKSLNASHAFHSNMMLPALEDYRKVISSIVFQKPKGNIVSSVTGKVVTDEMCNKDYWLQHLTSTVDYHSAISNSLQHEDYTYIEVGPGAANTTFINEISLSANKEVVATHLISGVDVNTEYTQLLQALGTIWQSGHNVNWLSYYSAFKYSKVQVPTYAFDRKRYWLNPGGNYSSVTHVASSTNNIISSQLDSLIDINYTEKIIQLLEEATGFSESQLDYDTSFIQLGLDSLLLTQVALSIRRDLGVHITFRQLLEEYNSIRLLAQFVESKSSTDKIPVSPKPGESNNFQLTSDDLKEIKKPFGAIAQIDKSKTELTQKQSEFLSQLTYNYNSKTGSSKQYAQAHRLHMADPRVVTGFKPHLKDLIYPIVANKSKGSRLWDIDGNEYIDVLNGFGSNMLGYQPEVLKKAVLDQIEAGYEVGPQHALAGEVCELICQFTGFDRAALCNTGSEAVLGAMRIARTVTGKSLIVAFSGSYHGIVDEVIVRKTSSQKSYPAAAGILPDAVKNMLVLDYGTDESLRIIEERASEIAAVLVEPVQSRRLEFQPVEFLKQLRIITEQNQCVLIFDEVITGFRTHIGGVQHLFGIQADIGTYGKVVGGGMPIGAIAGKRNFMDALDGGYWQYGDDSIPEVGVTYFAGTFVRHPLALAAAKASLQYFKASGPQLQETLNANTNYLATAINKVFVQYGIPAFVAHFGSVWKIKFRDVIPNSELLFTIMRYNGVHIWDGFPCFLTEAHSQSDIDSIVAVFTNALQQMVDNEFFTAATDGVGGNLLFDGPPVPGAKIGRDGLGNPAWFIADVNDPNKYLQIV